MKTLSWYILVAARIFVQRFFSNENCTNKYAEPVGSLTWPYCKRHVRPQVCALTNAISHVYRQLRPVGPRATRRFMHDLKRDKSAGATESRSVRIRRQNNVESNLDKITWPRDVTFGVSSNNFSNSEDKRISLRRGKFATRCDMPATIPLLCSGHFENVSSFPIIGTRGK